MVKPKIEDDPAPPPAPPAGAPPPGTPPAPPPSPEMAKILEILEGLKSKGDTSFLAMMSQAGELNGKLDELKAWGEANPTAKPMEIIEALGKALDKPVEKKSSLYDTIFHAMTLGHFDKPEKKPEE